MLKSIVLAAGKGTRLAQAGIDLPKAMRPALGKPLLGYVLDALPTGPEDTVIVVGYKREYITAAYPRYTFAVQEEQLGTGHAAMCALPRLGDYRGDVLICCGDMPLVRAETYAALVREHQARGAACTVLSGVSAQPLPFGRVLRDLNGDFDRIVEDRDCTPEERLCRELNAGIYVVNAEKMAPALPALRADNAQGEYYLTDLPRLLRDQGDPVGVCVRDMGEELIGVNTPEQLSQVEDILRRRLTSRE